ncbi:MAG: YARHG domain-containing protein [Lachnospiraceae bacterium]|nr:YARHG domain-containing protein [Lachnospiraceae bacterium]
MAERDREKYPLALRRDAVLQGKYIVGDILGQGGFGITYKAVDRKSGQLVALKEYLPDTMATRVNKVTVVPLSAQMTDSFNYGKDCFLKEAQTLAEFIGNPGIVRVYSYFEENGTAYFVMEYVEGQSFQKYLEVHGGRIPWQEAMNIMGPVMDALGSVHSKGIIHRDVTPDNIFITNDGVVKLLDFGAARYSLGDRSKSLDVVLKHGFAPKEQYTRRGRQGPFTDVYSVAASFYFAITGRRPPDSIDRLDEDDLVPPNNMGAKLPDNVEAALLKGLAVQPADRYQTMGELKQGLMGQDIPDMAQSQQYGGQNWQNYSPSQNYGQQNYGMNPPYGGQDGAYNYGSPQNYGGQNSDWTGAYQGQGGQNYGPSQDYGGGNYNPAAGYQGQDGQNYGSSQDYGGGNYNPAAGYQSQDGDRNYGPSRDYGGGNYNPAAGYQSQDGDQNYGPSRDYGQGNYNPADYQGQDGGQNYGASQNHGQGNYDPAQTDAGQNGARQVLTGQTGNQETAESQSFGQQEIGRSRGNGAGEDSQKKGGAKWLIPALIGGGIAVAGIVAAVILISGGKKDDAVASAPASTEAGRETETAATGQVADIVASESPTEGGTDEDAPHFIVPSDVGQGSGDGKGLTLSGAYKTYTSSSAEFNLEYPEAFYITEDENHPGRNVVFTDNEETGGSKCLLVAGFTSNTAQGILAQEDLNHHNIAGNTGIYGAADFKELIESDSQFLKSWFHVLDTVDVKGISVESYKEQCAHVDLGKGNQLYLYSGHGGYGCYYVWYYIDPGSLKGNVEEACKHAAESFQVTGEYKDNLTSYHSSDLGLSFMVNEGSDFGGVDALEHSITISPKAGDLDNIHLHVAPYCASSGEDITKVLEKNVAKFLDPPYNGSYQTDAVPFNYGRYPSHFVMVKFKSDGKDKYLLDAIFEVGDSYAEIWAFCDDKNQEQCIQDFSDLVFSLKVDGAKPSYMGDVDTSNVISMPAYEGSSGSSASSEDSYIFPNSDTVKLTESELAGLDSKTLCYGRNEIYARRGRMFDSRELQSYFNGKTWYVGTYTPSEFDRDVVLSEVERYNANLLLTREEAQGKYALDK